MNNDADKQNESSTDKHWSRLEKQLEEIDTREFLDGLTDEDLAEKGFLGDGPVTIERSTHEEGTQKEHLVFEPGVEFERLPEDTRFTDLDIEELLYLKDIESGEVIATRDADETVPVEAGNNVTRHVEDKKEKFTAGCRGKVLIIRDSVLVFPTDIDCSITLRVSSDKMQVFLDCAPGHGDGKKLSAELVQSELMRRGIKHGLKQEAIEQAVDAANQMQSRQTQVMIVEGTPPREGTPGKAEYTFDPEKKDYDFKILDDGRIDYKNTSNIIMAEKDDLLATIVDPQPGAPGIDVYGNQVAAESGTKATLTAGTGVRVSDDGMRFFSEINGSVMLNGSVIEVVNTYVVEGDVDYSTGNIDFNGNVFINGNVLDGFTVVAQGDVVVARNVESAVLRAGRDIVVRGGIQGKGKGLVSAGRDIDAEYAQNARIEAQGNIYIDNFTINSSLYTSKQLIMQQKRGVVIGGEVYAQRGIDVKVLGSENGVKTYVDVGTDFLVQRKAKEMEEAIGALQRNVTKIETTLRTTVEALRDQPEELKARGPLIKKAMAKKEQLQKRLSTVRAKRDDLIRAGKEQDVCFIKVSKTCYPDVNMKIRDHRKNVTSQRDNVRFYEDRKAGTIAAGAY